MSKKPTDGPISIACWCVRLSNSKNRFKRWGMQRSVPLPLVTGTWHNLGSSHGKVVSNVIYHTIISVLKCSGCCLLYLGCYREILAYAALVCTVPIFKDTQCRSTDMTSIQVFGKYTVGLIWVLVARFVQFVLH